MAKYTYDKTYFKIINTPNKAYFLGLLHADGWNTREGLGINLQEKDIEILEKFKEDLKYTGPLYIINKPCENCQNQIRLSISSKELYNDLINIDFTPAKSKTIQYPDWLEDNLHKHFIRGVFDGDGAFQNSKHSYNINFVGNIFTMTGIQKYLKKDLDINAILKLSKSKDIYRLMFHKLEDIYRFYKYIYEDSNEMFIKRKYDLLNQAFEVEKIHLMYKMICRNLETKEELFFNSMQEMKNFFGLERHQTLSYALHNGNIYKKKYYINYLKNEESR